MTCALVVVPTTNSDTLAAGKFLPILALMHEVRSIVEHKIVTWQKLNLFSFRRLILVDLNMRKFGA